MGRLPFRFARLRVSHPVQRSLAPGARLGSTKSDRQPEVCRRSPIVTPGPDSGGGGKMFARVSTLHGPPDLLEESIRVIRQEGLPAFRQRPGFNGILSLM